jgi:NAD(P)H-flavin reductase
VLANRSLTPEVHELRLRPDDPEGERFRAGQHIWIEIDGETRRPYSIASPPSRHDELLLCFNRIPYGEASNYLAERGAGSRVAYTGPVGSFVVEGESARDLLFIATGTGISPIRSMILDLLERRVTRRIDLLFGTRRVEDLLYPEEFHHLASHFANFRYHPTLSRPTDATWSGLRGRVTAVLPDLFPLPALDEREAYVCGRPEMIRDVRELLLRLGVPAERIHRDD